MAKTRTSRRREASPSSDEYFPPTPDDGRKAQRSSILKQYKKRTRRDAVVGGHRGMKTIGMNKNETSLDYLYKPRII